MPFTPKDWKNSPAQDTALSAEAIEDLETRVTDYTDSELTTHTADTTSVHGIADTSVLATDTDVSSAVSTHSADTTSVHGIADTSALATDSDVTAAQNAAVPKALLDAKGDLIAASAADTPGRLAVGTNGQVLTADSAQALGVKWAAAGGGGALPAQQVLLSDYCVFDGTDETTEFQAALDASLAANGELIIDGVVTLAGTVTVVASGAGLGGVTPIIRGLGQHWNGDTDGSHNNMFGSVIVDKCTTGPCLHFDRSAGSGNTAIRPVLSNFAIKLGVNKPDHPMVFLDHCSTSGFIIDNIYWHGDNQVQYYTCFAALHMTDVWNGAIRDCRFLKISGHTVYYTCDVEHGGNVHFDNLVDYEGLSGVFIGGTTNNNNNIFTNCKFYKPDSYTYYGKRTTSLPSSGATSIQLATGLSTNYFPNNRAVVLHSDAGTEIVHCAASGTPYDSATGVLTLQDATTVGHSSQPDMRVISANLAVTTRFFTQNQVFNGCHFEQTPVAVFDGNGNFTNCHFRLGRYAADDTGRAVFVGGTSSGSYKFDNCYMTSNEVMSNYQMAYGMILDTKSVGASIDIDHVNTYTRALASQSAAKWTPLAGDATYMANANYRVRLEKYGTQVNTIDTPEGGSTAALSADVGPVTSSTTLQDITGLGITIGASATEIWLVKYWLLVKADNQTMDAKFGFTYPSGTTIKWAASGNPAVLAGWGAAGTAGTGLYGTISEVAVLSVGTINSGIGAVPIFAIVSGGGTSGTVQLRFAQNTSDAGNLYIAKGSAVEYVKVSA